MESPKDSLSLNHFLAYDPGETTGWASANELGSLTGCGAVSGGLEGLMTHFGSLDPLPELVIYEGYMVRPYVSHAWSDVPTIQYIGAIKLWCRQNSIAVVEQQPRIKTTGYKWAGLKKAKSKKDSHHRDAVAHLAYYLYHQGLWEIRL